MAVREQKSNAGLLVGSYCALMLAACIALQIDATAAPLQRFMNTPIFSIPFFKKPIDVTGWKLFGSIGALMFAGRWVVQAVYARRAGRPVTPLMFWVMSLIGSNLTLMYFIYSPKQDMVGVLGNFLPTFVAAYNLYLELRHRAQVRMDAQWEAEKKKIAAKSDAPSILPVAGETAAGE